MSQPHGTELTPREREVLEFIRLFSQVHSYPPTVRQIANGLGLRSTATAHYYLKRLEFKGAINRLPKSSRSLKLREPGKEDEAEKLVSENQTPSSGSGPFTHEEAREISLLGYTAAGQPREAFEVLEGNMYMPASLFKEGTFFYLHVQGNSMVGAGIFDGDYVLIRRQDTADEGNIVLALTSDGEATIKRLRFQGKQAVLVAENPEYPPLTDLEFRILGKVLGVFRVLS